MAEGCVEIFDDNCVVIPINRHAGYYSTDEVISIYRSKLEKLRSLYVGQFGVLKNTYMEYRKRFLADTRKGRSRRTSFSSNPRLLNISSSKVSAGLKVQQIDEKSRANLLLRYHHTKGRRAVIERQAKMEYEVGSQQLEQIMMPISICSVTVICLYSMDTQ